MGYYIQTPLAIGKVGYLKDKHNAIEVKQPKSLIEFPEDQALVCVIENAVFDAAGYIFDDRELERALPTLTDKRKRTWLLMKRELVEQLSGYKRLLAI